MNPTDEIFNGKKYITYSIACKGVAELIKYANHLNELCCLLNKLDEEIHNLNKNASSTIFFKKYNNFIDIENLPKFSNKPISYNKNKIYSYDNNRVLIYKNKWIVIDVSKKPCENKMLEISEENSHDV
jgi:hypothetical protein